MRNPRAANRYAKSLLQFAIERNQEDGVYEDFVMVSDTIEKSRELELLLSSPIIKSPKKSEIINEIFSGKIGEISREFIEIIIRKKRENLLKEIADAYEERYRVFKHITVAEIKTASPLDDELRNQILSIVKGMTNDEIQLKELIDPSLLGGFILTVGDQQIDSSVKRRLNDYRQSFSKNPYIADL